MSNDEFEYVIKIVNNEKGPKLTPTNLYGVYLIDNMSVFFDNTSAILVGCIPINIVNSVNKKIKSDMEKINVISKMSKDGWVSLVEIRDYKSLLLLLLSIKKYELNNGKIADVDENKYYQYLGKIVLEELNHHNLYSTTDDWMNKIRNIKCRKKYFKNLKKGEKFKIILSDNQKKNLEIDEKVMKNLLIFDKIVNPFMGNYNLLNISEMLKNVDIDIFHTNHFIGYSSSDRDSCMIIRCDEKGKQVISSRLENGFIYEVLYNDDKYIYNMRHGFGKIEGLLEKETEYIQYMKHKKNNPDDFEILYDIVNSNIKINKNKVKKVNLEDKKMIYDILLSSINQAKMITTDNMVEKSLIKK